MTLRILIADDEPAARFGTRRALEATGAEILEAEDGDAALEMIRRERPDLVFLDLEMPGRNGLSVLRELGGEPPGCEIVVVTANDALDVAVECMRRGATDYLTKPFEVERLRAIARRNAQRIALQGQVARLQDALEDKHAFGALIGISRPMRELFARIERAAAAPLDVLVCGETGTGKELIAREIHGRSPRRSGPFVAVNTAAITESLAESELFGHVKGAFTGADADHAGVFERASGGTVFLDEIGDMPAALQSKILRVLQEREVTRLGAAATVSVDVRVVSATHQDLTCAVSDGHFRHDLYYRIKGVQLDVPPLRARREDVGLLAQHFLDRLQARSPKAVPPLSPDAVEALLRHHWPGNVRELEHVVTAAAAMAPEAAITAADLGLESASAGDPELDLAAFAGLPLTEAKGRLVAWFERRAIEAALAEEDGNVSAAARRLGIHRQSLQQKMTQLGLRR